MITDLRVEKIDDDNIILKYYFDTSTPHHRIMKQMANVPNTDEYKILSHRFNVAYVGLYFDKDSVLGLDNKQLIRELFQEAKQAKAEDEMFNRIQKAEEQITKRRRDEFKQHFIDLNEECPFTDEELNELSLEDIEKYLEKSLALDIKQYLKNVKETGGMF